MTKDSHTSLPRSCSHNGPTNPTNKPQLKATRKRNSRSKGLRKFAQPGADRPCGGGGLSARLGGLSANTGRTVQKSNPNLQYCTTNIRQSAPYLRTVRAEKIVRTTLVDRATIFWCLKVPDKTNQNKATQELAKNTTST
jgi:hypothetical protein